jgi:hypothetical protein
LHAEKRGKNKQYAAVAAVKLASFDPFLIFVQKNGHCLFFIPLFLQIAAS